MLTWIRVNVSASPAITTSTICSNYVCATEDCTGQHTSWDTHHCTTDCAGTTFIVQLEVDIGTSWLWVASNCQCDEKTGIPYKQLIWPILMWMNCLQGSKICMVLFCYRNKHNTVQIQCRTTKYGLFHTKVPNSRMNWGKILKFYHQLKIWVLWPLLTAEHVDVPTVFYAYYFKCDYLCQSNASSALYSSFRQYFPLQIWMFHF